MKSSNVTISHDVLKENMKLQREMINYENAFENITGYNKIVVCEKIIDYKVSFVNDVYEIIKDLYVSRFKGSQDQLNDDINSLNRTFIMAADDQCQFKGIPEVLSVWNQTTTEIVSGLKIVPISVISDYDIIISNMKLYSTTKDRVYNISFFSKGNQRINLSIRNVTFKGVYLSTDNSQMSVSVTDSIFTGAGIQIKSKVNASHLPVIINNCKFHGDMAYEAISLINTKNVSISSSTFTGLQCGSKVSVLQCERSQLDVRNISFDSCMSYDYIICLDHCNVSASTMQALNNKDGVPDDIQPTGMLRAKYCNLHISKSNFERNTNQIIITFENNTLVMDECSFRDNHANWSILVATTDVSTFPLGCSATFCSFSSVIIQNSEFVANNPSLSDAKIILSAVLNITFANVTFTNNPIVSLSCFHCWVEISSCKFINNSAVGDTGVLDFDESVVSIHTSIFLSNIGTVKHLRSKLFVTKSNFSKNIATEYTSVFSEKNELIHILTVQAPVPGFMKISFCTFNENYAKQGLIFVRSTIKYVQLYNCTFFNNSAITGSIATVHNSTMIIKHCTIIENSASGDGGTLSLTHHSILIVENTVFNNNKCGIDGGVVKANRNSTLKVTNSIFIGNKALGSDGGAIYLEDESTMISEQCLFMNNTAAVSGGAVLVIDHSQYNDSGSKFTQNIAPDTGMLV